MLFALREVVRSFIQLFPETFGLIFGCLSILKGTLCYLLGLPEPFLENCFLSASFFLGNSGGGCTGKYVRRLTFQSEKGFRHVTFKVAFLELHLHILARCRD